MVPKFKIRHLCQDLPILSRDVFFRYYVSDFSHTWNFLYKYLDSPNAPAHLTLGIDAVSLAFLAHQLESQTARDLGRRKYGGALRSITASLQDPGTARAKTTFEGAVLLDLCEKIAKSATEVGHDKHAHVEGALALVKLRGVKTFQPGPEMQALVGLSLNSTVCSLSAGQPADPIVHEIRQHAAHFISPDDPKWQLSGLILETTDLVAEMRCGILTPEERVEKSLSIDRDLEALALAASPKWPCHHKHFSDSDTRKGLLPDGFPRLYTVYPTRTITQMSNVLRLTRILLCEEIIASCAALSPTTAIQSSTATAAAAAAAAHAATAKANLSRAVREVCASVPQMTDCEGAARPKLPPLHTTSSAGRDKGIGKHHTHTTSHILDVYVLVFSLYVVASTPHAEVAVKEWSVQQLEHVSAHFGVREAGVMVGILRRQKAEIMVVEKEKLAMDGSKLSGKEVGIKEGDVRGENGEGHSEVKGDSWWYVYNALFLASFTRYLHA